MSKWVDVRWEAEIATVVIRRPDKRNALHEGVWQGLREAGEALAATSPRAVILMGEGEHFSAGMDLSPANPLMARMVELIQRRDEAAIRGLIAELNAGVDLWAALPCPTIAAVEGVCVGSGLELALACDMRVVGRGARMALPETRVGLAPDVGGARRLHALVGRSRAVDLIATCRTIEVDEALGWGLIDRVVPQGSALEAATALAREMRVSAPGALAATLELVRALEGLDGAGQREAELKAGSTAILGGEALEGAMAFMERRAPSWA